MRPTRRRLLAGAGALIAGGAARARPQAEQWIAYEARLRARLDDAAGGRFDAEDARALLAQSNAARKTLGVAPLAWNATLAETARAHAADLAHRRYFEHVSPEGFDPTDRLGLVGRKMLATTSENIAYHRGTEPASAADLFDLWRKSPPHWNNLRSARHSQAGFGVVRLGDRAYAAGLYAHPDGELAAPLPFRLRASGEIAHALGAGADRYLEAWLEDQCGPARRRLADGAEAGVWRLRLDKPMGAGRYMSLYGPIVALGAQARATAGGPERDRRSALAMAPRDG